MSTEGRTLKWSRTYKRYELRIPREQHGFWRFGDTVEAFSLHGQGPCYVKVGAHIHGNRFECVTSLSAPED